MGQALSNLLWAGVGPNLQPKWLHACTSPSCQDRNKEKAPSALGGRIVGQPRLEGTSKDTWSDLLQEREPR